MAKEKEELNEVTQAEQLLFDLLHYTGHVDCHYGSVTWKATRAAEAYFTKEENEKGRTFRFTRYE